MSTATSDTLEAIVPAQAEFNLTLNKLIKGNEVMKNPVCHFAYHWDFSKNMGLAVLNSINGVNVNIQLHPLGISGYLDFMSDMKPTVFYINLQVVIIYRVILDIELATGKRSAAIMFNVDGSTIQASGNWLNAVAAFEEA